VLAIAYYFPPLGGIGSIRAMKFAAYLPDWGWQPTVLAPFTGAHPRDESLVYSERHVIRTRAFDMSRFGKRVVGLGESPGSAAVPGFRARLRRFAHRFLYHPDAQIGWYPFAVAAGRRALRETRFDAIFSSSFPVTAHLVARQLHRESGLPWIAEFRDPWADVAPGARAGDRRDRLERSLLRDADAVVTVSPSWRDRFLEKGAARVEVVTNGFDPVDLPTASPIDDFVVTHLGSFYPRLQDLRVVWEALRRMRALEPGLRLRVKFVGEVVGEVREQLAGYGLTDVLEATGFLSHRSALAATAPSSVLIAAGFHAERPLYRGVVPAKLFEYLGSGLPILYVSAADTDAARLLDGHRACYVVEPGDVDGALHALAASRREGRVQRDVGRFTRQALAGDLARTFEGVCSS